MLWTLDSSLKRETLDMSSEENFDVSVIVLTKNSAQTIDKCLRSVTGEKPGEVVAVDGSSTDGTVGILKRHGVTILTEPVNSLGLCRQMAVEASKGRYVMFVDSDVVLAPGCVSRLRRDLESHGWAGVHARLLSAENASYWQRAEDETYRRMYNHPSPTHQIDTIAAMFRRAVLLSCPFDPYFKESFEDVDLSRRLIAANYGLGISGAIAYHYHRRTFSAFARQRFRGGLGMARFGMKYGGMAILLVPLSTAISNIIRNLATPNARYIPYWVAKGIIGFLGVLVGLSRLRHIAARNRNAHLIH
jgi:glycosyltransferase involved in cell wall biosynthesis